MKLEAGLLLGTLATEADAAALSISAKAFKGKL